MLRTIVFICYIYISRRQTSISLLAMHSKSTHPGTHCTIYCAVELPRVKAVRLVSLHPLRKDHLLRRSTVHNAHLTHDLCSYEGATARQPAIRFHFSRQADAKNALFCSDGGPTPSSVRPAPIRTGTAVWSAPATVARRMPPLVALDRHLPLVFSIALRISGTFCIPVN